VRILNYTEKYNNYSAVVGEDLFEFSKKHLEYKYCKILKGEIDKDIEDFIVNNISESFLDKRTPLEFATNKIMEHLMNIYIKDFFKKKYNIELENNGSEGNELFINSKRATNDPDFKTKDGKLIEVQVDGSGYITKKMETCLRLNKLNNLKKLSEKQDVFLLLLDLKNKKFYTKKITTDTRGEFVENIQQFGGKFGYKLNLNTFKAFDLVS